MLPSDSLIAAPAVGVSGVLPDSMAAPPAVTALRGGPDPVQEHGMGLSPPKAPASEFQVAPPQSLYGSHVDKSVTLHQQIATLDNTFSKQKAIAEEFNRKWSRLNNREDMLNDDETYQKSKLYEQKTAANRSEERFSRNAETVQ